MTQFILFLERDTNNIIHTDPNASIIGRTVFIDYIKISTVELKNIYLFFYKDTLVSIKFEGGYNLPDAFTYKYNKPSITYSTKFINVLLL